MGFDTILNFFRLRKTRKLDLSVLNRQFFNPLRIITPELLSNWLDEAERGRPAYLQRAYRIIEKRDSTLRGLKLRRLSAIQKLEWTVVAEKGADTETQASLLEAQKAALAKAYSKIKHLNKAIEFLALASFRGFSHLEKIWGADGSLVDLQPVPQWHFCRDYETWNWVYDPRAMNDYSSGTKLDPAQWVSREVDDPINEIGAICFIRKNLSQKDWDRFVEDFGIPSLYAILGDNVPEDKMDQWLEMLREQTSNSRGVLPPGTDIKTIAEGRQGEIPFKSHKDEQKEELVLAGTGGILSMLTAPTGLNSDQAAAHDSAFDAIAMAEAAEISELLNEQVDAFLLDKLFPGQPHLARFSLNAKSEEDLDALAERAVKLNSAGLVLDAEEMGDRFGLKLTAAAPSGNIVPPLEEGAILNAAAPDNPESQVSTFKPQIPVATDPLASLKTRALSRIAEAEAEQWAPLTAKLDALATATTPEELRERAASLLGNFDAEVAAIYQGGKVAEIFGEVLAEAASAGATATPENAPISPSGANSPASPLPGRFATPLQSQNPAPQHEAKPEK